MPAVVHAQGALLQHTLTAAHAASPQGLTRRAFTTIDAALAKTAWGARHQRRYALVEGDELLACALRYELAATFAGQPLRICAIGEVCSHPARGSGDHARVLVEHLVEDARRDGCDVAIVFAAAGSAPPLETFRVIPTRDVEVTVMESPRYGAPMTLVRGAEDRDLAAIVAMGEARADGFRFRLVRDHDFVKYVVTRKRLLAGLASPGVRQVLFVIAEEGITAAAYAVISIVENRWTIEECGDRDPSGARVGAILQALIARDPAERRPVLRGWLPPGFAPPQLRIVPAAASDEIVLARSLSASIDISGLSCDDVLYWRNDCL